MSDDAIKLDVFKRLNDGDKIADLVMTLGIAYPTLLKYRKEFEIAKENNNLNALLNIKPVMLERIANELTKEIQDLTTDDVERDALEGDVTRVISEIDGYNTLNLEVTDAAVKLTKRISVLSGGAVEAKEISLLTEALTKIQVAFFNKSGNFVQINNSSDADKNPLGEFQQLLTS